ncbi:MAG: VIT1/CCC1 transporter family protein [Candidatus Micrarchaeota archaeon]|nr:VIT1/CCC1 transporter family protein [Candidatus Micrarchaeota archaeon]
MKGINDAMASRQKLEILLRQKQSSLEKHSRPTLLSNFILGCQDGLVNVLGIILGVSAATSEVRIIFVAALAALAAESISMGAVAYTSTIARRKHYLRELEREKQEMRDLPETEKGEVRDIFKKWGYRGKALEDVTQRIVSNPKAWLEFMMAHELDLEPIEGDAPMNSAFVVGASAVVGSIVPLIPFFFTTANILVGTEASVVISAITLFAIGAYEAKTTVGSLWRSGLQMLLIGLVAGFAGYVIGSLLGAAPI